MTDDELLEQFLQPVKTLQVPDDGFTGRVMRRLPTARRQRLSRLWTAFCVAVAVVLFVVLRGWEQAGYALLMLANGLGDLRQHLLMAVVTVVTVVPLLIAELMGSELRHDLYFRR